MPYSSLLSLLDEEAVRMLRNNIQFTPAVEKAIRRLRRDLFLLGLEQLQQEFGRVPARLQQILLYSPMDRPELARRLLGMRWSFFSRLWVLRLRAHLFCFGWGSVSVLQPLQVLGHLQTCLQSLEATAVA